MLPLLSSETELSEELLSPEDANADTATNVIAHIPAIIAVRNFSNFIVFSSFFILMNRPMKNADTSSFGISPF